MGLKPGNDGNWFQTVPMVETALQDPDKRHARRRDEGGDGQVSRIAPT